MTGMSRGVQPPNTVRAEALSPELIMQENGYPCVRVPLRTETGTIVYAELEYGEAQEYATRLGRLGYQAQQTTNRLNREPPSEQRTRRRGR
ncbi:hypothetical protein [Streptomyces shenzhenensis]|uniref:hypothetical protein n=1 Tax=Streptomyces shenzhenensis TaxID=943815 RepID=UPI003689E2BB